MRPNKNAPSGAFFTHQFTCRQKVTSDQCGGHASIMVIGLLDLMSTSSNDMASSAEAE
jgi:hypothetical protein